MTHPIDTPENRAAIRRDLATIVLTDASPRGMEQHLESFNSIILQSHEAGSIIAPAMRAQMLADTLPQQLESLRTVWGVILPTLTDFTAWPTMLRLYNEEIERRRRTSVMDSFDALAVRNKGQRRYEPQSDSHGSEDETDDEAESETESESEGEEEGEEEDVGSRQRPRDGQSPRGRQETRTCWTCGRRGHLASDCNDEHQQSKRNRRDNKASRNNYGGKSENDSDDDPTSDVERNTMHTSEGYRQSRRYVGQNIHSKQRSR